MEISTVSEYTRKSTFIRITDDKNRFTCTLKYWHLNRNVGISYNAIFVKGPKRTTVNVTLFSMFWDGTVTETCGHGGVVVYDGDFNSIYPIKDAIKIGPFCNQGGGMSNIEVSPSIPIMSSGPAVYLIYYSFLKAGRLSISVSFCI